MFQVRTSVVVIPSTEVRRLLGIRVPAAGLAAWREIARQGKGLEMAHFQIVFDDRTLAISSRIRTNGSIAIEIGIGDPR